jgi:hypothetical protein
MNGSLIIAAQSIFVSNTTWDPSNMGSNVSLSDNNLEMSASGGGAVRGTTSHSSGKWYFEIQTLQLDSNLYPPVQGICTSAASLNRPWIYGGEYTVYNNTIDYGAGLTSPYGITVAVNDVIGFAIDLDNQIMTCYKNGTSLGEAYNSSTLPAGTYYPLVANPNGGGTTIAKAAFTQSQLKYSPPAGFHAGW